jgi:hypothetical protein
MSHRFLGHRFLDASQNKRLNVNGAASGVCHLAIFSEMGPVFLCRPLRKGDHNPARDPLAKGQSAYSLCHPGMQPARWIQLLGADGIDLRVFTSDPKRLRTLVGFL